MGGAGQASTGTHGGPGRGPTRPRRLAIVAGESSGDQLAAGLVRALRARLPGLEVEAVAGPALQAEGCEVLAESEELAVMGLAEVLPELRRLWQLRGRLLAHWRARPPDVFIGVDAPDFNLGLARRLRAEGVPTAHYVSPTVWAWRPGRVHKIARCVDTLLCLYPFEPECYAGLPLRAVYVGHPFAAAMAQQPTPAQARAALGLDGTGPYVALVPGSRAGEVARVAPLLLAAAQRLHAADPRRRIVLSAADARRRTQLEALLMAQAPQLPVQIVQGQMRTVLRAADVALVTSGTATLETLLAGTPMGVTYRAGAFTNWLLRDVGMLHSRHVSLPNILAGRALVPEFLQEQAEPAALARAATLLLDNPGARAAQREAFARIAATLHQDTDAQAAQAVLDLCAPA